MFFCAQLSRYNIEIVLLEFHLLMNGYEKNIETGKATMFLCFIIIVFGAILSLISNNWQWFYRSWSLLVVFDIYIVRIGYEGK